MPGESEPHRGIKELIENRLREWFGASIKEYPSAGHVLDTFAVTSSSVSIYVEVIWFHSKTQFLSDINMLQQSDADVKVAIGSPEVRADASMVREFAKVVISQRRAGKIIYGDMLDGMRILEDSEYVEDDLKRLFEGLVDKARSSFLSQAILQIVDLEAVKSRWASGNFYNLVGKVLCKGQKVVKRLNARLEFLEAQAPVRYVSVSNSGKVNGLDIRKLDFSWSPDGSDENNRRGEFPEMRQGDSIFAVFPDAVGSGFSIGGPLHWWKHFFLLVSGSKCKVKLVVTGISDSQTVIAEKIIEFTA